MRIFTTVVLAAFSVFYFCSPQIRRYVVNSAYDAGEVGDYLRKRRLVRVQIWMDVITLLGVILTYRESIR